MAIIIQAVSPLFGTNTGATTAAAAGAASGVAATGATTAALSTVGAASSAKLFAVKPKPTAVTKASIESNFFIVIPL